MDKVESMRKEELEKELDEVGQQKLVEEKLSVGDFD